MKKVAFVAVLLMSSLAVAAYSPATPPPGWTGTPDAWSELFKRADYFAKIAANLAKGASLECVRSTLLEVLIGTEIGAALDPANQGRDGTVKNTRPGDAERLRRTSRDERENSCRPPSGGSPTANIAGITQMTEEYPEWEVQRVPGGRGARLNRRRGNLGEGLGYLYGLAKPSLTPDSPWVLEMLKLGVLVPAVKGAAARVAGSITLPILNPELFMKREPDET